MPGLLTMLMFWARKHMAPGTRYPVIAGALQRFSTLAVLSVALLLFTGVLNSIVEVGKLSALLDTGYGRALLIKLLLLIPLLGVGASNAYLARPDLEEAVENPSVRNRQTVLQELESQLNHRMRIEIGIGIAVLAVVALLVQLTPTRGRLEAPDQGAGQFVETAESGDIQATLSITPNQPGDNTFEVYLAGGVDKVDSLRLEFVQPGGFGGDSRLDLQPSNPPTFYIGKGPYFSQAGTWSVILNIRVISGASDLRFPFTVNVAAAAGTVTSTPRSGGSFGSPVVFTSTTTLLLALSAAASLAIVLGSMSRPGMPEGYLGWLTAELAYRLAPLNVRPVWTLSIMVVAGLALGLIVGQHLHKPLSQEEARGNNPVPASAESIARGKMLFQQNCTICHGDSGRGDGPAAATLPIPPANLYDHIPYHPDQFFFGVMTKGLSGVMPAFENQISEEDRWNILNYLRANFTATPADR
jgi:copper transport protein